MDDKTFLESAVKQFTYYKFLGEACFKQLNEAELLLKFKEQHNSIGVIVNHLAGNMVSRWTDPLTSDGEKEWRNRDQEFEDLIKNESELWEAWERGWQCVFRSLSSFKGLDLNREIYIRNQGHTIFEAINRQLCHYSYHVGQIVCLGKLMKGDQWVSLSIPLNQSKQYNKKKFGEEKSKGHFTDEFLDSIT